MVEEQQQLVQSPRETPFSRTDPDFLFNSLNSVEALSRQAPERIPELVRALANYLRYWLQPAPDGWVTLQQELDALTSFLQVERIRFQDQFEVELDIAEDARPQRVPQFFLQPLVENVLGEEIGAGPTPVRVVVHCRRLDHRLWVEVRNTRVWLGMTAGRDGLEDLGRRLDLLYKEGGYGWTSSEGANWMSLAIEVPLQT
jgi:LytS/YehU family sensor histidine kinase